MNDNFFEIMETIVNALTETLYFLEIEADAMAEKKEADGCEKNVSITLDGDAGDDSSVAEFLKKMLPQLDWDLVPYSFLWDLYRAWMQKWYPDEDIIGRQSFIREAKRLSNIWGDEWICPDNPVRSEGRMDELEVLIFLYDLHEWQNPEYEGNNINEICKPQLKPAYRGLLRKSVSEDDDTDGND